MGELRRRNIIKNNGVTYGKGNISDLEDRNNKRIPKCLVGSRLMQKGLLESKAEAAGWVNKQNRRKRTGQAR